MELVSLDGPENHPVVLHLSGETHCISRDFAIQLKNELDAALHTLYWGRDRPRSAPPGPNTPAITGLPGGKARP